jgi:hypothetical protein
MILSFNVEAQSLSYSIGQIEFEEEMVTTIRVKMEPKPETIKDSFEDWMDDKYDVDLDGKSLLFFDKKFMTAKGVTINEISPKKIDLLVKVNESNSENTTLDVFASFGYNNWITPETHLSEFISLENIVSDFIAEYLPQYYLEKMVETEEKLVDLKEDNNELNEQVKDNMEELAELKKENDELITKIRENQKRINNTKNKLSTEKKQFKTIKKKIQN